MLAAGGLTFQLKSKASFFDLMLPAKAANEWKKSWFYVTESTPDGEVALPRYSADLSSCNDLSLDLNTSSTQNSSHACVNSPCISCRNDLNKYHDDMLMLSCCHVKNASISSSSCVANHVEENEDSMGQDKVLKRDTSAISSSPSSGSHMCLMAKGTKVTSLNPIVSHDDDEVENDNDDYRGKYDITSIKKMG